ncbi:MAG: hypothetical protein ABIK82_16125 [Pseudomonadota bacterium]
MLHCVSDSACQISSPHRTAAALAAIQANRTVVDDGSFYGSGKNLH